VTAHQGAARAHMMYVVQSKSGAGAGAEAGGRVSGEGATAWFSISRRNAGGGAFLGANMAGEDAETQFHPGGRLPPTPSLPHVMVEIKGRIARR